MTPYVALGLPSRSMIRHRADRLMGAAMHAKGGTNLSLVPFCNASSLLNHTFNNLWCCLHNLIRKGHEFTHFAMLHDDILPECGWLPKLLAEQERVGADFLSVVVPIKDSRGLTSTAAYEDDIWDSKRLTIRELQGMPETSTDADFPGKNLLLNTGCCVLKLRGKWLENPKAFPFQTMERIDTSHLDETEIIASVVSEDWLWTDKLAKHGAQLAFTRKISLVHEGDHDFTNDSEWGRWDSDKAYEKRHADEDPIPAQCKLPAERQVAVA